MSVKAQAKTQTNRPAVPAAARLPQPPLAVPEREAEQPAIVVQLEGAARLGHSLGAVGVDGLAPLILQRQGMPEEEDEDFGEEDIDERRPVLQRQEQPEEGQVGPQGGQIPPGVEAAIRRARGGGQPLERVLQEQMSASMGHDFSGVRVHTDSEAAKLSHQLQAKAFTTGADIFFRRGDYDPSSSGGRELITHELTHVVQQSSGQVPARGDGSGMTVRPAGDAFEREADAQSRGAGNSRYSTQGRRAGPDSIPNRPFADGTGQTRRDLRQVIQREEWKDAVVTKSRGAPIHRFEEDESGNVKVLSAGRKLDKLIAIVPKGEIIDVTRTPLVKASGKWYQRAKVRESSKKGYVNLDNVAYVGDEQSFTEDKFTNFYQGMEGQKNVLSKHWNETPHYRFWVKRKLPGALPKPRSMEKALEMVKETAEDLGVAGTENLGGGGYTLTQDQRTAESDRKSALRTGAARAMSHVDGIKAWLALADDKGPDTKSDDWDTKSDDSDTKSDDSDTDSDDSDTDSDDSDT